MYCLRPLPQINSYELYVLPLLHPIFSHHPPYVYTPHAQTSYILQHIAGRSVWYFFSLSTPSLPSKCRFSALMGTNSAQSSTSPVGTGRSMLHSSTHVLPYYQHYIWCTYTLGQLRVWSKHQNQHATCAQPLEGAQPLLGRGVNSPNLGKQGKSP